MDPLTSIAPGALRSVLQQGPMSEGKLRFAWRLAVGAAMDRATDVALRDGGVVEVAAAELTWRREVKRSAPMILSRLQGLIGAGSVTKIRVVVRSSSQ